jgi:hypothetical protein
MDGESERLLSFFQCLVPEQRYEVLAKASKLAFERCCPGKSVTEFAPTSMGGLPCEPSCTGQVPDGTIDASGLVLYRALHSLGEPDEVLHGTSLYDEGQLIPWLREGIDREAREHWPWWFPEEVSLDLDDFFEEWRTNLARACEGVSRAMARSAQDAESQDARVPDASADWVTYALMIDGDAIANELDRDDPGRHDVCLKDSIPYWNQQVATVSPPVVVLEVRLALYCKLRFLQAIGELPPTEDDLRDIEAALEWLRANTDQDSSAHHDSGTT